MKLTVLLLLLLLNTALPAAAQSIVGLLVSSDDGGPVSGALITLVDSAGQARSHAITRPDGRYLVRAPAAGAFRLRAERIGYETVESPVIMVGEESLTYRFEIPSRAVRLPAVDVRASARGCQIRPDGPAVQILWDNARRALMLTRLTQQDTLIRYSAVRYARFMDRGLRRIDAEEHRLESFIGAPPYLSRSPDLFARNGFLGQDADSVVLYGPDASVLLSDAFLAGHCFRTAAGDQPGRIGLAFEPLREREDYVDIRGVLWVDAATAELQQLTWEYVNLPASLARYGADGEMRFARLPNGSWIVQRWWIRSPRVEHRRVDMIPRAFHVGTREDGGMVSGARDSALALFSLPAGGTIEGTVWDSVHQRPLQGATVYLSGTPWATTTDEQGRYRITNVPPGPHRLAFNHTWLRELFLPPAARSISVAEDQAVTSNLGTLSPESLFRIICPGQRPDNPPPSAALIFGVVRSGVDGGPLSRAQVRVGWDESSPEGGAPIRRWRTITSGPDGRYHLCWIPTGRELEWRLQPRGGSPAQVRRLPPLQMKLTRQDAEVPPRR